MTVDLSLRNDTGSINQSPVSSMASYIIHPCSLHQQVFIPGKKETLSMLHIILVIPFIFCK